MLCFYVVLFFCVLSQVVMFTFDVNSHFFPFFRTDDMFGKTAFMFTFSILLLCIMTYILVKYNSPISLQIITFCLFV